jgi:pimeloyl-ACP methyl ester carboxylesterase
MSRTAKVATTAGAFVAAGVVATLLNGRQRHQRRLRRGEDVEFGSVHSDPVQVTASDGVQLNVEIDEAERKTPTVVFVHGWVESIDVWHYQRLALRGKVRMVFVDLRSHGESGRSYHDNSSIPQLADDLRTIISTLVPRGPIVLVGHSMGGMAIMELAAAEPKLFGARVKGVVLISTSSGRLMRSSPGLRYLIPMLRVTSPMLDWGRTFNSYSIVRRWGLGVNAQERHVDMTNEMILKVPTHVLMDFYPNFVTLDLTAGLKVMGKSRTVVIGGTADLVTPIKHSRRLAEQIPGAKLVALEDIGHMVMFEEHQKVTEVIEDVLEGIA